MLSRQSPRALRRAQLLRCPLNAATRRAESTDKPSNAPDIHDSFLTYTTEVSSQLPDAPASPEASKTRVYTERAYQRATNKNGGPVFGKIIFSGIQPTGVPHLGNYLGALRQWVKLQDEGHPKDRRFYSIVDLHAITVPQDPQLLVQRTRETYASLIAIGLDPNKSVIFAQQDVLEHTQLMWILSCHASMGYLGRMTQWKSKAGMADNADPLETSAPNKPALKLGLFSYPVLQAADILLYNATHVPVGEDQAQHLEFTRELGNSINHLYAKPSGPSRVPFKGFFLPQTIHSPAKRIMSLQDPTKKMSKSDPDERSRILITDSRDEINLKIKHALTDSVPGVSYDRDLRPGVSNLIDIMYYMDESKYGSPEEIAADMFGKEFSLKVLKEQVATTVADGLEPIRERYNEQMARSLKDVDAEMGRGASMAKGTAAMNLQRLKAAMGIRQHKHKASMS